MESEHRQRHLGDDNRISVGETGTRPSQPEQTSSKQKERMIIKKANGWAKNPVMHTLPLRPREQHHGSHLPFPVPRLFQWDQVDAPTSFPPPLVSFNHPDIKINKGVYWHVTHCIIHALRPVDSHPIGRFITAPSVAAFYPHQISLVLISIELGCWVLEH